MKVVLLMVALVALTAPGVIRVEETWKGTISDSMCGMKHSADKHGDTGSDHKSCVEKCIGRGGEYVFLSGEKVYKIANQKLEALKAHAGHEVMLTGEMKGDSITVSKIEMPKAEKK
jgi:hypothetical protein